MYCSKCGNKINNVAYSHQSSQFLISNVQVGLCSFKDIWPLFLLSIPYYGWIFLFPLLLTWLFRKPSTALELEKK